MKSYYKLMLGRGSKYASECRNGNYIGVNFDIFQDLTTKLPDNWKDFNREFIPIWLEKFPDKSKVAAGLACGALHTVCKGIQKGDIILSPNGDGAYFIGEVKSNYYYVEGSVLPHRRKVEWKENTIDREKLSQELKNSLGTIGTVSNITRYSEEIESLIIDRGPTLISTNNSTIEDPSAFALEKHLEEFLVANWHYTELGVNYDIYEVDGEIVGQQFPSDTGPIDILAISKDHKEILVVELKRGRASDVVVGQIQRYMGYILEELAEEDQIVKGAIIALEDDQRLRRALAVANNIDFYKYQISFKLSRI